MIAVQSFKLYSMLRNNASGPEIGLPGQTFWPDSYRESTELGPPTGRAGRRADFGTFPVAVRPKSGPEG